MAAASGRSVGIGRQLRPLRAALTMLGMSLVCAAPSAASELSWDGPPGCASSDALSFELERALGGPLASAGRLRFHVRVERSESMASARLDVSGLDAPESGGVKQRLLVADDCSTLVDTLAVAIGLAIGASEMRSEPTPADGAAPAPRAPLAHDASSARTDASVDEPAPASPSTAPGPARPGLRPSVTLDVVGDAGALPNAALGAQLGVALHSGSVAVRASGTLLLDQRVRLASTELGATAEVGLGYGTVQGCIDALGAPEGWMLAVCAGLDAGQLWGRGVDVARARRAASWWLAPRVDARLSWPIAGTALRAGGWVTASAPLQRDEFVVDRVGVVHRPGLLVGRIGLGLEATLE